MEAFPTVLATQRLWIVHYVHKYHWPTANAKLRSLLNRWMPANPQAGDLSRPRPRNQTNNPEIVDSADSAELDVGSWASQTFAGFLIGIWECRLLEQTSNVQQFSTHSVRRAFGGATLQSVVFHSVFGVSQSGETLRTTGRFCFPSSRVLHQGKCIERCPRC